MTPRLQALAGPDGGDLTVVSLAVDSVELMSFVAGIHPLPVGLKATALERTGDVWVEMQP